MASLTTLVTLTQHNFCKTFLGAKSASNFLIAARYLYLHFSMFFNSEINKYLLILLKHIFKITVLTSELTVLFVKNGISRAQLASPCELLLIVFFLKNF